MSGTRTRRLYVANTLGLACIAATCFLAACSDDDGGVDGTPSAGNSSGGNGSAGKGGAGAAGKAGAGTGGSTAGAGQAGEENVAGDSGQAGEGGEAGETGSTAGTGGSTAGSGGTAGGSVGGTGGTTGGSGGSTAGSGGKAGSGGSGGSGGAPVVLVPNCARDTTSGKRIEISTTGNDGLFAAAYGPDSLLYAAGYVQDGTGALEDRSTVVVRILPTGALDPTWGIGGVVKVNVVATASGLAGLAELPRGIAFQGSKIIVSGTVEAYGTTQTPTALNNDRNVYVLRLTAAGALDTTFGDASSTPNVNTGIHILPLSQGTLVTNATTGAITLSAADAQWGLNILPDNKIIVTAATRNTGLNADNTPRTDSDFAVVRLTADGAQDATFGLPATPGIFTLDVAQANASVRTASVLGDGKLIVTGYSTYAGTQRPVVFKLLANGSALDTSFGSVGVFSEPVGTAAEAYGALVQSGTNKLVTVGYGRATSANATSDLLSIRLTANGLLDTTYGPAATPGRVWFDVGGLGDNGRAVLLSDNRPVLLGGGSLSSGQQDGVVVVLGVDGAPVTTYGSPFGCTAYDFGSIGDFFWAGALASDGKIAAVGLTGETSGSAVDTDSTFVLIPKP